MIDLGVKEYLCVVVTNNDENVELSHASYTMKNV